MGVIGKISQWTKNEDGAVSIIAAVYMTCALLACAFAVDLASLYLERRSAQGAADLAAIAGASDMDHADAAARATLAANRVERVQSFVVTPGRYEPDSRVAPSTRFTPGRGPANAVHVELATRGDQYFASRFMSWPQIRVRATAASAGQATFSIGSRLAAVRDGLPNAILGAMLGGSVNLSVSDYNSLLNGSVSLQGFLNGLASQMHVNVGSFNDVLSANATVGDVLSAAAKAAQTEGQTAAASTLLKLLGQTSAQSTIELSSLVQLGRLGSVSVGEQNAGLGAALNLMSLVSAAASAANGAHQVSLTLPVNVPGLLSVRADVTIGEAQQHSNWVAVGEAGATIYTAQIRVRLLAEVAGTGLLAGVRLRVPIYVQAAQARATLSKLSCAGASAENAKATISARPGVVSAWIGEVSDAQMQSGSPSVASANIVQTALIQVRGSAHVEMTNVRDTELEFTQADVRNGVVKRVETADFVQSVVASLLGRLNLQVNVAGLGLSAGPIAALVGSLLAPVAAPLDGILQSVLSTLGVHLGEADVQVNGMRCGVSVLTG